LPNPELDAALDAALGSPSGQAPEAPEDPEAPPELAEELRRYREDVTLERRKQVWLEAYAAVLRHSGNTTAARIGAAEAVRDWEAWLEVEEPTEVRATPPVEEEPVYLGQRGTTLEGGGGGGFTTLGGGGGGFVVDHGTLRAKGRGES
jgi:hypothetical protein